MEMHILALDRHTNAAGLNRLMGSQSLNLAALINWIYIGNKDINEYYFFFKLRNSLPLKRPHTIM